MIYVYKTLSFLLLNIIVNMKKRKSTSSSLLAQGVLGAVLSAVMGARDPEQVNMLAKQAGEVCSYFFLELFFFKCLSIRNFY